MTLGRAPKIQYLLLSIGIFLYLCFCYCVITADAARANVAARGWMKVGVIIDAKSRSGKEEKTAMEIAVQNFNNNNNSSKNSTKFRLHFNDSGGDPLQAASVAEELIQKEKVQVIIGMDTWEEAALVADIGKKAQVPVLSFATPATSPPLSLHRWPFLVRMSSNDRTEMSCVAAIVHSYGWRRIVVITEDGTYSSDSGQIALLSEALRGTDAEIEYSLVLPPANSLSDPKGLVVQELEKLLAKQSRVFIVLRLSTSLAVHLFKEANRMGLMDKDSAWILTESVTNFLDSFNSSTKLSLNGALGTKAYYEASGPLQDFSSQFRTIFRSNYFEEDNSAPGIHALRAYDSIRIISEATGKLGSNISTPKLLLQNMLSTNFIGLSGQIRFNMGELWNSQTLRIVNVIGNGYKELEFCPPTSTLFNNSLNDVTGARVHWPGDLDRIPKGWAMPTRARQLKIGVPGRTTFEKFVKVEPDSKEISGFCIEVFKEVVRRVEKIYALPHEFKAYNCTYDDLVNLVYNKTLDAVVGDVTILADRTEHVDFTQPFTESGLSMITPAKSRTHKAWIFMKPFTMEVWVVTGAVLIYTMFIVWFLEHRTNPHFRGRWNDQLGTALWFTFSSLFFAHRERLHNNFTRVVVVVWLFVVFILTSSYTASLSSMLTVQRLESNVTDINWLRNSNQRVGCDGDSFVRKYLVRALKFKEDNILNIDSEYRYPREFETHNITAAFLEVPYAKAFLKQYCKGFTVINPTYRFGGLAFVFQKGSPIVQDFSKAILAISEDGTLKRLEEDWISPKQCSTEGDDTKTQSLDLQSFWGLYAITGSTSTLCLLLFVVLLIKNFRHRHEEFEDNATPTSNSVWYKAKRLAHYFHDGKFETPGRSPTADQVPNDEQASPGWVCATIVVTPERSQASTVTPVEMPSPEHPQASLACLVNVQSLEHPQVLLAPNIENQSIEHPQPSRATEINTR